MMQKERSKMKDIKEYMVKRRAIQMKCMYENGKLIFENVEDGNYVLITNGINDLSLYRSDAFKEVEARIVNLSKSDNKNTKRMARYLFTNAENVDVNDGVMILTERTNEYIYSDEFEVEELNTHLRLIGENITKEQAGEYDIIEKILKD